MRAFSILDKTYSEQLFHTAVQIQSDCVHTWSSPIRILAQSTSIRWYRIQAKSRPNPIRLRSHWWTRYPSAVQIQSESTSVNPPLVEEKRQDITDVLQRSFKQLFMWLSNPGHCKITLDLKYFGINIQTHFVWSIPECLGHQLIIEQFLALGFDSQTSHTEDINKFKKWNLLAFSPGTSTMVRFMSVELSSACTIGFVPYDYHFCVW